MHTFRFGPLLGTFVLLSFLSTVALAAPKVDQLYKNFCSSCHGPNLEGGLGSSLVDDTWAYGGSPEAIAKVISEGIPAKGMPPWKGALNEDQIRGMVIYIQEQGAEAKQHEVLKKTSATDGKINSALHNFKIETLHDGFNTLWAMDFLPNGKLLATEKAGKLWLVSNTDKTEIAGTPVVWPNGQGGLMDVRILHDGSVDPWVYLSFSKEKYGRAMTTIVRGKIKDNKWVDEQTIFLAPLKSWINTGYHYGSRIIFQNDFIYFSIGDRGRKEMAQALETPNGKVHRLHLDGRIPADNPFVKTENAMASIWSYGHRNPQGLTLAEDGRIWLTEHGPRGGDETNLLLKGKNYGWPIITYGMNYNGTPITDKTHQAGMEQPKHYWVPSIAVTAVEEYRGKQFPKWNNQLIVGSLAKEELQRLKVDAAGNVVETEVLMKNQGRIRDIRIDAAGVVYLVVNRGSEKSGSVLKLTAF